MSIPERFLHDTSARSKARWLASSALAWLALACSEDGTTILPAPETGPEYILSRLVFGQEGTTMGYVNVLGSLDAPTVDTAQAREFPGAADVWVHDGSVFVTNPEDFTITKFSVERGELIERGVASFAAYGLADIGFWLNAFVSADKAYLLNETAEFIVWNPATMEIVGTFPVPAAEPPEGLRLFNAYSDRSAVLRDGLLYQPFYYTDESFFSFAPSSRVLVIDVANDSIQDAIDAPCPGLDYATIDEAGNIYFSGWVYAAGGAAVLEQPPTCVFEVPAAGEPRVAFSVPDLTEGRQGAAMRYVGAGRALISVLHEERFEASDTPDASALTFANNWRFWSYELGAGQATLLDAIDWNGGAQYSFDIDGTTYMLVAASDYSKTSVYDLGAELAPRHVFDTDGWATRLFRLH